MIQIHTGLAIVKLYYSSNKANNSIALNTSLTDVIKMARNWKKYDKNSQEQTFEIKYSDGRMFTSYKKDEIKNVTLDQLLNVMAFPLSGEVLHIHGAFQDINANDEEEGDDISL